jgi:hypothetical protein
MAAACGAEYYTGGGITSMRMRTPLPWYASIIYTDAYENHLEPG